MATEPTAVLLDLDGVPVHILCPSLGDSGGHRPRPLAERTLRSMSRTSGEVMCATWLENDGTTRWVFYPIVLV
jgi:hypothetical protein